MWRCWTLILAGVGFLVVSVGVAAQPVPTESRTVTVVTGDWPPYVTQAEPDHGPMAQVISRVFNDAGYQVKYIFQPWKRSKEQVLKGDADVLMPAYCSPDRADIYLCSDTVITGKQVLFHRVDTPLHWTSVEDLRGYIIGGTLGYYYGNDFETAEKRGELQIVRVASDATNMRLLMKGRIQLYPQDKAVGFAMLHELYPPERWPEITADDKPLHKQSLHLLFTRETPRGAKLKRVFDNGLTHLRHTGELSQIMSNLTRKDQIMPVEKEPADAAQTSRPPQLAPVE
ncbi:substrate-binding periplasmic protein [Marinobacter halodurans]|nr:transporter substrate-binding domain-containing protein [Marinobacter halodurans]